MHAGIFILLATLTYAMTVREGWALKVLPLRHAEHPLEIATHSVQMATTDEEQPLSHIAAEPAYSMQSAVPLAAWLVRQARMSY